MYALRAGVDPAAWPVLEKIGEVLAPLGVVVEREGGSPGPDVGPIVAKGATWAQLAQDGTDYFDYHHTANDTLANSDSSALHALKFAKLGLSFALELANAGSKSRLGVPFFYSGFRGGK